MAEFIGRVGPVDPVAGGRVADGTGAGAGAGSFDDLVSGSVVPPLGDGTSASGLAGTIAAHLDASRVGFERGVKTLRTQGDAVSLAKLAVLQSHYSNAAQVTVRAVQKGAQALNDLTRLQ